MRRKAGNKRTIYLFNYLSVHLTICPYVKIYTKLLYVRQMSLFVSCLRFRVLPRMEMSPFARELQSLTYTRHSKPTFCVIGNTFIRLSPTNSGIYVWLWNCQDLYERRMSGYRDCVQWESITNWATEADSENIAPNIRVRKSFAHVRLDKIKMWIEFAKSLLHLPLEM